MNELNKYLFGIPESKFSANWPQWLSITVEATKVYFTDIINQSTCFWYNRITWIYGWLLYSPLADHNISCAVLKKKILLIYFGTNFNNRNMLTFTTYCGYTVLCIWPVLHKTETDLCYLLWFSVKLHYRLIYILQHSSKIISVFLYENGFFLIYIKFLFALFI